MMRRGLSLVLAFVVAAAPSICLVCCAAIKRAAAAESTPAKPPACECCQKPTPAERPTVPTDHCPCRDKAEPCGRFVATMPTAHVFDAWLSVPVVAFDLAPAFPPSASSGGAPLRDLPFLTVSDLLHVQHRLRC
ncbi:MAG: hypothetical protein U0746_16160 [Gemmataceae bacterium]